MTPRLYGPRWHGVVIGVLSTVAGLASAHLAAGISNGAASPVTAVGSEFIDIVPPWLKDLAIQWFGTNDKLVLLAGILSVLVGVGAAVGVLAQRQQRSAAYVITAAIGAVGAAAVVMRPEPSLTKLLPTVVGTGVSIAVLWWLAPRFGADRRPRTKGPLPRRSFVQGVSIIGLCSVLAGTIGELLARRFDISGERANLEVPDTIADAVTSSSSSEFDAAQFAVEGVDAPQPTSVVGAVPGDRSFEIDGVEPFVVPTDEFYRIDTALSVPQVSRRDWSLRVHGMVDRELSIDFDELLSRPQIERFITLSCVSNEVGGGLVGNARWQGVRLADVLAEAGIQPGATQVVSRSVDGWNCGSPTAAIMDGRDALLAIAMNGEPLPAEHGYPVRLVVPGLYGYVSATKWVTEIELTRCEDFDAYWVPRGWSKVGPVKTMARIDRPGSGRNLAMNPDGSVDIAGLAWAVHRGISRVEVSIDDGAWLDCELAGVPSDDTWRQWRYRWADASPGDHTVRARAVDGFGEPQPAGPAPPAPDGAEGYHQVEFQVS